MKKDFTRDYTVEMFRFWAALGCPRSEEILMRLAEHNPPLPPTAVIERGNNLTDGARIIHRPKTDTKNSTYQTQNGHDAELAALLDALAAARTVESLKKSGKEHIISALKAVYLTAPRKKLGKGEISDRIRRCAASLPSDERSVYRWLREARSMCATRRGLRIC